MAKIEPKIFDELKTALVSFGDKYFVGEELNRSKLTDDLRNYDEALLSKLFEVDFIKQHFIKEVAGQKLFQIEQLEEAVLYNDYWDTSYTKYENRVGLASKGKFLQDSQDVVLDFPFKDGVLTASMTKEDNEDGYDDAFLNEIIEKDEIDRLFDKKVFVNVKRFGNNQTAQHSTEVDNGIVSFDKEKDNLIIKGNNLLALHTLADKYAGQIKLIYIDPPYNTGSDSFAYNDKFNHSAWLTFMKNRLEIARDLLSENGIICIQCDDNQNAYLKVLLDSIFGRDKFMSNIVVKMSEASGVKMTHAKRRLPKLKEYILTYKSSVDTSINIVKIPKNKWDSEYNSILIGLNDYEFRQLSEILDKDERDSTDEKFLRTIGSKLSYQGLSEYFKEHNIERQKQEDFKWNNSFRIFRTAATSEAFTEKVKQYINQNNVNADIFSYITPKNKLYLLKNLHGNTSKKPRIQILIAEKYLETNPGDFWSDIKTTGLDNEGGTAFKNAKKPEQLIQRIIEIGSNENDIVLDFFMGSATTQAVAMKMNRRFIGIEQMDYINEVSVPRLQKVIAGEQGGISKVVNWQGGGSFVYAELFPKNMGYLQDVIHAKDLEELKSVYERMLSGTDTDEPADISFRADLSKIDWLQGFDENKRLLVKLLDKNGLYYNYSEIDDKNVRDLISDEDYTFNKNFYEGGD
ncbi:DNA methyltransferase [Lactococcus lactis]|uniref:DNA methyltransferase n=1 Tax=Lactococcus lactis TaxID=1358 RepID=UPI002891EAAE|nr:DNA methyltransferase [Lactococcus lactis]MDT2901354.1 DNA methyltransferase [Lactococcus lactis]